MKIVNRNKPNRTFIKCCKEQKQERKEQLNRMKHIRFRREFRRKGNRRS